MPQRLAQDDVTKILISIPNNDPHCAFFARPALSSLLTFISDSALRPIHAVQTPNPTKYFIVGINFNPTQYVMMSPSSATIDTTNRARLSVGVVKLGEMMAYCDCPKRQFRFLVARNVDLRDRSKRATERARTTFRVRS